MRNVTLRYMSAVALGLANLAETSGHNSLVALFRKASAEAELLQELEVASSAVPCHRRSAAQMPIDSYGRTLDSMSSADSALPWSTD
jgi:hypothetical protein